MLSQLQKLGQRLPLTINSRCLRGAPLLCGFGLQISTSPVSVRPHLTASTVYSSSGSEKQMSSMRQGFAGMLWSKQFYHYALRQWLQGDPGNPSPPEERKNGRNKEWPHLYNA